MKNKKNARETAPGNPEALLQQTGQLVQRYRDGDDEAFAELFAQHREPVHRAIARRLGYNVRELFDVEDVLQETFAAAVKGLRNDRFDNFETPGSFRNLLVKIATNRISDIYRHLDAEKRRGPRLSLDSEIAGNAPRPSEICRGNELQEVYEHYLLWLSDEARAVIDMVDNLGMSHREIGQELGVSEGGARQKYHRAKRKLKELLEKHLGSDSSALF